jgi:hypothetical protein
MRLLLPSALTALLFLGTTDARAEKPPEGFVPLFNGKDLTGWRVHDGKMNVWGTDPENHILFVTEGGGGWLLTEKEYDNFELKLEYKTAKMGNSGVALRAPRSGDPAYEGMEIQIIDELNWKGLQPWQLTGAIYNVVPPSKMAVKPFGEWNTMHIVCNKRHVSVTLNGVKTVDADLDDHKDKFEKHPGLKREKGHVGFQSYNVRIEFRNIYLKPL